MKKIFSILIVLLMLAALVACNGSEETSEDSSSVDNSDTSSVEESSSADSEEDSNPDESGNPGDALEGSLEDILEAIYAAVEDEDVKQAIEYMVTTEIDTDNCEYYFGVESLDVKEAIASEAEIGPSAYSLCLVRANSTDDIEALKEIIAENVNPYKWVCVGVEDNDVIVDSIGDVIILIMYEKSDILHDAFASLQ
jgi:hypothetical protein